MCTTSADVIGFQSPSVTTELPSELAAVMASISNDSANGRPERREPSQQSAASPPVRHVGWFDAVGNRETEDINQDVALSSFHSLVPIEATNAALFSYFHRLAVHDDDCGIWLSTRCQASQRIECTMQQRAKHQTYTSLGSSRVRSARAGSRWEADATGNRCGANR
jgi:hypothetical protein